MTTPSSAKTACTGGRATRCTGRSILLAAAFSLLTSPWALLPAAALSLILLAKSLREEHWLAERYPAYAAYRARVRRRFFPFLW